MKFIHCKNCNEEVAHDGAGDYWYHVATDKMSCYPHGAYTRTTYAEPTIESRVVTDQGPIFGLCENCGSTIVWEEDEYDDGFWTHDDGWLKCSPREEDRRAATPKIPDEIAFKDGLGDEISVGSNSGSEIRVGQNSGLKIGSHQNSGPPFKVEPAQPVTPPQTGGTPQPPLTLAFKHLVTTLYGMRDTFNDDQEERVVTDLENLEDAIYHVLDVVGSGSSMP